MNSFSAGQMGWLLGLWGLALVGLTWWLRGRDAETAEGFTTAGRRVGPGVGAATLLASWVWALSLYAPAEAGYKYGLAGPLYYSLGGALMLAVFTPFVGRVRRLAPAGHTIAEFVGARLGPWARGLTATTNLLFAVLAVYFNLSVVGYLVTSFSPLPRFAGVLAVAVTVTAYSLLSGMKASVLTDLVQFVAMTAAGLVVVPMVLSAAGGVAAMAAALPELGEKGRLLSSAAFWQMGLPWLILSTLSGFTYQSVWQRAWVVRPDGLTRAYLLAAAGWFPYSLAFGMLGLVALTVGLSSPSGTGSDIAPAVVAEFLSGPGAALFVVLVLAAACSTCDSSLCAASAIAMTDLARGWLRPAATDAELLRWGRVAMLVTAAVGALLATAEVSLLQLIFVLGAAKAALVFPLLSSLYWDRVNERAFVLALTVGSAAGLTSALWLRSRTDYHALLSVLAGVLVSVVLTVAVACANQKRFDFGLLETRVRRFGR